MTIRSCGAASWRAGSDPAQATELVGPVGADRFCADRFSACVG